MIPSSFTVAIHMSDPYDYTLHRSVALGQGVASSSSSKEAGLWDSEGQIENVGQLSELRQGCSVPQ